jgi:TetR/AcrR family transcriptional regulator, tetracycline repressor protein
VAKSQAEREALSRERVLKAALVLLDREGLSALSMRRVGQALGVEAMSLYHHVASKGALLDGIYEIVLSELPVAPPSRSWSKALRERAHAFHDVLRAHPHALPLFATRPAVTTATLSHVEGVLELLRGAGFSAADALQSLQTLSAFVVGHCLAAYAPREDETRPPYATLDAQRFPRVLEAARLLGEHDPERDLSFGLDALITGLSAHLPPSRRGP